MLLPLKSLNIMMLKLIIALPLVNMSLIKPISKIMINNVNSFH